MCLYVYINPQPLILSIPLSPSMQMLILYIHVCILTFDPLQSQYNMDYGHNPVPLYLNKINCVPDTEINTNNDDSIHDGNTHGNSYSNNNSDNYAIIALTLILFNILGMICVV
jgi:hypothetical protein